MKSTAADRHIIDYAFVVMAFFVIGDAVTFYQLLRFGHGLPNDWGIFGRLVLPAMIFACAWRFRQMSTRVVVWSFSAARFFYFNTVMTDKPSLSAMLVASVVLLDIVGFCASFFSFKQRTIADGHSLLMPLAILSTSR